VSWLVDLVLPAFRVKARRQVRKHRGSTGFVIVPLYPGPRGFWAFSRKGWSSPTVVVDDRVQTGITDAYPVSQWIDAPPGRHRVELATGKWRRAAGGNRRPAQSLATVEIDVDQAAVPVIFVKPRTRAAWGKDQPARIWVETIR
jgi:hypothetical protein